MAKYSLFILILMLLYSCSTEVDITGKAEHKPVIYAIVDANAKTQLFKIHRTFLADGNIYNYTTIPDSIFYPYKFRVKLQELNANGQILQEYPADTVHIFTQGGNFFTGYHPYYRIRLTNYYQAFNGDTFWFNPNLTYKLIVLDTVTGKSYEAIGQPLSNFEISKPSSYQTYIGFTSSTSSSVDWKATPGGKIYEVKFIFDYFEISDANPQDTIKKSIEWYIGKINYTGGDPSMSIGYNGITFFDLLQKNIPVISGVKRYPGYVWLIISVADENMDLYIKASSPSNSIVQDKLSFTNISDALGIFAFRLKKTAKYKLSSTTLQEIFSNEKTKDLNFNGYFPNFQ